MKLLYLPLLALLALFTTPLTDTIDKVSELIAKGNTTELAKLFAPSVDISIADQENTYTRDQAALVLQKFFAQNAPRGSKMLHKINSSANYSFGVIILNTDKGPYRIAFTLKEVSGVMQLIDLKIETEKVK
ncbi:MAG: hypothetical protein JWQ79_667 [Mucilaginibacter sp.]|jgi:hypothetical protein|nr:hypothetical protein [Mucilaginibacter sp.]